MTSPDPAPPPQSKTARRHVRIRTVPLRPAKYAVHTSLRLEDFRPVYAAAKASGMTPREFMRKAVMRAASKTLMNPRRTG